MYAEIIIEIAHQDIDRIFSYKIPEEMSDLQVGMRVKVPFGVKNKKIEGYIIGFCEKIDIPENKIKYIFEKCEDYPIFTLEMIELAKYMKDKYYCTLSECLQCIMPSGVNSKLTKKVKYVFCKDLDFLKKSYEIISKDKRLKAQMEILKLLMEREKMSTVDIKNTLKVSQSSIESLEKKGIIEIKDEEEEKKILYFQIYTEKYSVKAY